MPYIWVFNMSTVTFPILEVIGKSPIIPHCSPNHWQEGASFPDESSKPTLESFPGQMSQGQVLSARCLQSFTSWKRKWEPCSVDDLGMCFRYLSPGFPWSLVLSSLAHRARRLQLLSPAISFQRSLSKRTLQGWWPGWDTHGKSPNIARFPSEAAECPEKDTGIGIKQMRMWFQAFLTLATQHTLELYFLIRKWEEGTWCT